MTTTDGQPRALRILHVLGFLSESGVYGGPTSVAVAQCRALQAQGHFVTLLTGWDGRADHPAGLDCERRRAWRLVRRSFASLVSPAMLWWLVRHARAFDVVHVHLGRDLVTLPIALLLQLLRVPVVLQPHGMVMVDRRWSVLLVDALMTRRAVRGATAVLSLTARESTALAELGAPVERIVRVRNPAPEAHVAAEFSAAAPLVVFVSRLAKRKRPVAFVEMAEQVLRQRPDARVELWGPDGGQLAAVETAIRRHGLAGRCIYRGACPSNQVLALLGEAQVLVLPSVAEPYPMVVLEALSVGLPCVVTNDTGLSESLQAAGAALVTDGSPGEMARGVLQLVNSRSAWQGTASAARSLASEHFTAEALARSLTLVYARAVRTVFETGPVA